MKKIKLLLIGIMMFILLPGLVNAASAKISVTGANSVVVGNTVTVTVKISSNTKIGSWQMNLNYNSEYLKLISTSSEGGGTMMVNSSSTGTKAKSYTFKFKALKSGTTKISVPSYLAYDFDEMDELDVTASSKSLRIMTQSELEATYSSDAYLKNIKIGDYVLSPKFNKNVFEYNVEVENDVTSVKVVAPENDSRSEVNGAGTVELEEGNNKVEIVVTAQKGNSQTYIVNIYRKELDPISVKTEDGKYTVVRKENLMPSLQTYSNTTVKIDGIEVPALSSDITGYVLIGVKDDEGNVLTYLYEDGKITKRYTEIEDIQSVIYPLPFEDNKQFKDYEKREVTINGVKVDGVSLNKKSKNIVIYAHNIFTGDYNYYVYDLDNNTISVHNDELSKYYENLVEKYKYVVLGMIGFSLILMFIIILRKPKKIIINAPVRKDDNKKKEEKIEEVKKEQTKDSVNNQPKKKNKNKNNNNHNKVQEEKKEEIKKEIEIKEIDEDDALEIEATQDLLKISDVPGMSKSAQKKLIKQQKKLIKEERRREKARKEFDF